MSVPNLHIAISPKRDWLWKHEVAELFCISRVTLWDWLKRLDERGFLEAYNPMCRKLKLDQLKQICELLDYPFSTCLDKMNQAYTIKKLEL